MAKIELIPNGAPYVRLELSYMEASALAKLLGELSVHDYEEKLKAKDYLSCTRFRFAGDDINRAGALLSALHSALFKLFS